jgi:hypothetical protein
MAPWVEKGIRPVFHLCLKELLYPSYTVSLARWPRWSEGHRAVSGFSGALMEWQKSPAGGGVAGRPPEGPAGVCTLQALLV